MEFNRTTTNRKNPIKRNSKFFSGEDFDLEMAFATEYMEQDANQTVVLYQVDLDKTKVNDIYKEAVKSDIRFKTPVELTCVYEIQEAEVRAYNEQKSKGLYAKPGVLTFSVLTTELEAKNCDVSRGDFVGVDITPDYRIFFTVTDDGKMNTTANKSTIYGKVPYYRTIKCAYIDENEFSG